MIGDPMEAWMARGRELNAIYATLRVTMRDVLPHGGAPTARPSAEAACHDIEALGAEVKRLREVAAAQAAYQEWLDTPPASLSDEDLRPWNDECDARFARLDCALGALERASAETQSEKAG